MGTSQRAPTRSSRLPQRPMLGNFDRIFEGRRLVRGPDDLNILDASPPKLGNMERLHIKPAQDGQPSGTPAVPANRLDIRRILACTVDSATHSRFRRRRRRDSSSEDDDATTLDDASVSAVASLASTPATSPDVSPVGGKGDDHNDVSDLEGKDDGVVGAQGNFGHKPTPQPAPLPPSRLPAVYPVPVPVPVPMPMRLPPGTAIDNTGRLRQITVRGELLPLFSELQKARRAEVSRIVAASHTLAAAEKAILPWDAHGNLISVVQDRRQGIPASGFDFISRSAVEPLYRVEKDVRLKIVRAILDATLFEDALLRSNNLTMVRATQPIHVFVDVSNIIIGFYQKQDNTIKQARFMPTDARIPAPIFSFEAFTAAAERGRPCAKRVLAGSIKAGAATPGFMLEAAALGYEMNVLQRVQGSKRTRTNPAPLGVYIPESWDGTHREQAVDEILQLKMMQTLIDTTEPGVMVVATGDAAEAEFSDGFHKSVVRALGLGWLVEVVGFRNNMSSAWFAEAFREKWAQQLRILTIDGLVEELLAS
ncbi:hypothetical protein M406DRAFT_73706 [Cryphonectria parasitica EP155]|uniref:NYN domain-containing protein n=1 Tax=Cryphonectria parasitica (strain ATCC 38755 / EP155) TaxID=660469 RepID=A0A9P5CLG9_CRYP1|nr:uncharacterized protein M406DRAFT_73706 [Cryphonectria parasitica EP155]KAF3763053.1 hypothetical protein M406DRAFT_73706 [Cryphonectria parasitica EP155]